MPGADGGRLKVLLVDDDPLIRRGYGDRLAAAGWDITIACDGFEAVQAARDDTFDVVLLDLRMPYRDGAEVLRTLRRDPSFATTRVFLLAQPGDADLVEEAAREGVEAVFEKARLGPRDIVAELRVRLERPQAATAPAASVGAPAAENVPNAVDEIARRFRRGHRTFSGDGAPSDTSDLPANLSKLLVATPDDEHVPVPAALRETEPQTTGAVGEAARVATAPVVTAESADARTDSPADVAAERTDSWDVAAPATTDEMTGGEPLGDGSYNVVLNRYVGEAGALAAAVGLSPDLMCPDCQRQLALRLAPDARYENAVLGFFYCPRCTGVAD